MKTIVFIGTLSSGSSREAIKAAELLGFFTVLLTNRSIHLRRRRDYPEVHYMELCDLNNFEMMKNKINQLILKEFKIEAIISFVEPNCYQACLLADEFGIGRFTSHAVHKMQNKILSREALKESPYVPWFRVLEDNATLTEAEVVKMVPFILKNPNSTGSKDVYLIRNYKDFVVKREYFKNNLIEEYLDGPQYLIETLVVENKVKIIAVIKQDIIFNRGHFIVTGYNLMINLENSFYSKLKKAVESIIKLHGMENGACHLEMRYINNNWKLIEVNPRISGSSMNEFIEIGLGINIAKETLKLAVGNVPNLKPKYKKNAYTEYIVLSNSGKLVEVIGRKEALKSKGVKVVFIKPKKGSMLTPPASLANRYAYVIATGDNEIEAEENAKRAAEKIKFKLVFTGGWT